MAADLSAVQTNVVVIGAGPAGLAVGACLRREGISFVILERADRISPAWHRHYERLHLHTPKSSSALPYLPFPSNYPTYPSRQQIIDYLEDYSHKFNLTPRLGEEVKRAEPVGDHWEVETSKGSYRSQALIIATGLNMIPCTPEWPGLSSFAGKVLHSSQYSKGAEFKDQRVLVVGFGNSGGEIAIDLWERGAYLALSVRSPVNIIPRDLLGIPIATVANLTRALPDSLVDILMRPILAVAIGDMRSYGLRPLGVGPATQIARTAHVPLIDVGTIHLIKQNHISVHPGITSFEGNSVEFEDNMKQDFDAVILATGYRPQLEFLQVSSAQEWERSPMTIPTKGRESTVPNLYFIGFSVAVTGMLREIGIEARSIAKNIASHRVVAGPTVG